MDVLNKKLIMSYLLDAKDEGRSVFASSHELDQLSGLSDYIYYLTVDGKLIDTSDKKINKLKKVQIVFKEEIAKDLKESLILVSSLGRVATFLVNDDDYRLEKMLARDDIAQYDLLSPKIEDYFYLEAGGEENA